MNYQVVVAQDNTVEVRHTINIPAQSAVDAFNQLIVQTGVEFLFPYDIAKGHTTKSVKGEYSAIEALGLMLQGSGLSCSLSNKGAIRIFLSESNRNVNIQNGGSCMRSQKKKSILTGVAAFLASLVTVPHAVGEGLSKSSEEAQQIGSLMIEEVVVTARRREESLQDVPISISAFDSGVLDRKGVTQLRDLEFSIPNLSFTDQGNAFGGFGMRGIYTLVRTIGVESGVAVYVDGVYQGRNSNSNMDTVDIERIEVLKGPQGTLFGRNTISGAVNITTKKAADEFEATVKASHGNLDRFSTNASISGPIIKDKLAARLSVSHYERDGYTKNLFTGQNLNSEDRQSARVNLRFTPNEQLEINASGDWFQDRADSARGGYLVSGAGGFDAEFARTKDPRVTDLDGGERGNFENRDIWGASVTIDYTFTNDFSLSSITAYREGDFSLNTDFDGTRENIASGFTSNDSDQFTQELKLSSPNNLKIADLPGDFDFVTGFFYLYQDTSSSLRSILSQGSTDALAGPFFGGAVATGDVIFGPDARIETDAWAYYANANWHLTDSLTLTVGIRYSEEEKDLDFQQVGAAVIGIPTIPSTSLKSDETDVSPTFSIFYDVLQDVSIYGTISRGFKSAGFNADVVGNTDIAFDPENVTNYEVGFKSLLFDRRLKFNGAFFFQDYEDLQVQQFIGAAQQVSNAAQAEIYGMELEASALLTDYLSIDLGFGYLDAEFKDFPNANRVGDNFEGNKLQSAPKTTANAALQYLRPVSVKGMDTELLVRAEWAYRGEQFFQANNDPFTRQGGYSLFNARVGLSFMSGKYEIAIFGENLGDKIYASNRLPFLSRLEMGFFGPPRTYGVEVAAHF